jgi:hypothetical protein
MCLLNRSSAILVLCIFFSIKTNAQCPTTFQNDEWFCSSNTFNLGVGTSLLSTYSWYINGVLVQGPFAGDGDPRSFNFDITSAANAGRYTVVQNKPGCPPTEILVRNIYWSTLPLAGLTATSITPYSVSFNWNSTGSGSDYMYEVTTTTPTGSGPTTTSTNATVNNLNPGTIYNIYVTPRCEFGDYSNWTSISFTTLGATVSCPGSSSAITAPNAGAGYTYQWQVATSGTNFTNIANGAPYSNVTTTTLNLTTPSTSFYGYKYRCVATRSGFPTITSNPNVLFFSNTWNGNTSTAWNVTSNWSCGVLPDNNTDVVIPLTTRKPAITSDVSCRKVTVASGSTITVNSNFKLTVTGNNQ